MSHHLRIELRSELDERVLAEVRELIDVTAAIEGHPPVGEHKHSHLAVGARGWVGILAYSQHGSDVTGSRLVGYAHTRWNAPGDVPRLAVEVVVHPDFADEGVARMLLHEVRAVLGRAGGGVMYLWVHRVEQPEDTLAARLGYRVQRELAYMTRSLEGRPALVSPPDGVTLRPFEPGTDDHALLAVNNAAFEGHPENGGWDHAELVRRMELDWFDPKGLILAWRAGELLGFHWTKWHAHDTEETPAHAPVGEVYVLGIHPSIQGLGLGRVLLQAGLAHLHDRGCRLAVLYVDRASDQAVRLYESEGFVQQYQEVCYADEVPPVIERLAADLRRPAF
jgi:mycothiol synthase